MDTVEELGGTYFYKGVCNISAGELFFWICLDEADAQLGVQDILALAFLIVDQYRVEQTQSVNRSLNNSVTWSR